jgi:hypothetical protein
MSVEEEQGQKVIVQATRCVHCEHDRKAVEEEKSLTVIVQSPDKHWMCSLWTPVPGHDGILEGIFSGIKKKGERRVENTTRPRNYNVVYY